jgi:hypothetical protein
MTAAHRIAAFEASDVRKRTRRSCRGRPIAALSGAAASMATCFGLPRAVFARGVSPHGVPVLVPALAGDLASPGDPRDGPP